MRPTLANPAPLLRSDPLIQRGHGKPSPVEACSSFLSRHCNPRVLLATLVLAIVLTASAHFLQREWSSWLSQRVPTTWAHAASVRTLQRLDATVLEPSSLSTDRQNIINTKFAALRIPQGAAPLYELVFRHGGGLSARSFTLAGGQIVLTDESVQQFANDRALLAALSVQLGHLQNRDALRSVLDHAPVSILLALFRGDAKHGARLIGDAQPVMTHDKHCEEAARQFGQAVMQANP